MRTATNIVPSGRRIGGQHAAHEDNPQGVIDKPDCAANVTSKSARARLVARHAAAVKRGDKQTAAVIAEALNRDSTEREVR